MSVGVTIAKANVDATGGNLPLQLDRAFAQIDQFQAWLIATPDATLITMGYAQAEVNTLKSAFADLAQLATIYRGSVNLAVAKDFRTFAKQIWGFGL